MKLGEWKNVPLFLHHNHLTQIMKHISLYSPHSHTNMVSREKISVDKRMEKKEFRDGNSDTMRKQQRQPMWKKSGNPRQSIHTLFACKRLDIIRICKVKINIYRLLCGSFLSLSLFIFLCICECWDWERDTVKWRICHIGTWQNWNYMPIQPKTI